MNSEDNKAKSRAVDSLLNFETVEILPSKVVLCNETEPNWMSAQVKVYGAEEYEVRCFQEAILRHQVSSGYSRGVQEEPLLLLWDDAEGNAVLYS